MASTQILLRISPAEKAQIKAAADIAGTTLTRFMIEAALKRAARTTKPAEGVRGSLPAWFRAICAVAAQGGSVGYDVAGYKLASSLAGSAPSSIQDHEWGKEIRRLKEDALSEDNRDAVWTWMEYHYPKFMDLVPPRRKEQFIDGVFRAYQDGRVL